MTGFEASAVATVVKLPGYSVIFVYMLVLVMVSFFPADKNIAAHRNSMYVPLRTAPDLIEIISRHSNENSFIRVDWKQNERNINQLADPAKNAAVTPTGTDRNSLPDINIKFG